MVDITASMIVSEKMLCKWIKLCSYSRLEPGMPWSIGTRYASSVRWNNTFHCYLMTHFILSNTWSIAEIKPGKENLFNFDMVTSSFSRDLSSVINWFTDPMCSGYHLIWYLETNGTSVSALVIELRLWVWGKRYVGM